MSASPTKSSNFACHRDSSQVMPDSSSNIVSFKNCRLCKHGGLVEGNIAFSPGTGLIEDVSQWPITQHTAIDLQGTIVAPGFLELQTNGMRGFHFTHFEDHASYSRKLDEVAAYLPSQGVTGFYATIPTVASDEFKKVSLPTVVISEQDLTRQFRYCRRCDRVKSLVVPHCWEPMQKGLTSIRARRALTTNHSFIVLPRRPGTYTGPKPDLAAR